MPFHCISRFLIRFWSEARKIDAIFAQKRKLNQVKYDNRFRLSSQLEIAIEFYFLFDFCRSLRKLLLVSPSSLIRSIDEIRIAGWRRDFCNVCSFSSERTEVGASSFVNQLKKEMLSKVVRVCVSVFAAVKCHVERKTKRKMQSSFRFVFLFPRGVCFYCFRQTDRQWSCKRTKSRQ